MLRPLTPYERKCLNIIKQYPDVAMNTSTIRSAMRNRTQNQNMNNKMVLRILKQLRSRGYIVSEIREDHKCYWELSK